MNDEGWDRVAWAGRGRGRPWEVEMAKGRQWWVRRCWGGSLEVGIMLGSRRMGDRGWDRVAWAGKCRGRSCDVGMARRRRSRPGSRWVGDEMVGRVLGCWDRAGMATPLLTKVFHQHDVKPMDEAYMALTLCRINI